MRLRSRLKKLQVIAAKIRPPNELRGLSDEQWLTHFKAWDGEGLFDTEPDFPVALAWYDEALATTFDEPPATFEPLLAEQPTLRLEHWCSYGRAKAIDNAWLWLSEMLERVIQRKPPVTEAEFKVLAAWFEAHDSDLYQLSLPSQLLNLGNGKRTCIGNLRYGIRSGPRALGAGEVVEELRTVKECYGEQCERLMTGECHNGGRP
jgi:hypothetical protein